MFTIDALAEGMPCPDGGSVAVTSPRELGGSPGAHAVLRFLCRTVYSESPTEGAAQDPAFSSLDAALKACRERHGDAGRVYVSVAGAEPATALNEQDGRYLPPEGIVAAGGYVVRRNGDDIDLLLIHRRGEWDLPKGKLDPGESPEAGALREVSEEVGVPADQLTLGRSLGTTLHGYPHPKRATYAVKTTHWFSFTCDAEHFTPQAAEDITEVAWVQWDEAGRMLGFDSLRRHHASIDVQKLGPWR